ncbi:Crp/Fnr family transcriptional regulator [Pseudooceanicola sp.]|uniref:Crp/Fnr family transcriptional regulator n=1 Tax=Pseudooceanicola sp. TaxID=1914328 RepID=UPI00262C780A|nr:Crp/Fnr family transcriptional regulator [Pseudooceanicola sp.]MDF1855481.1 Crp/Fnr family transcriptional regulator [Pseudooceanicola sp.]
MQIPDWITNTPDLAALDTAAQARLAGLVPRRLPAQTTLFHPGDAAQGYVVVLSGTIDVFLVGASGREMLLYSVTPQQSCIQTTLGLISGVAYTAGAETASATEVVVLPKPLFLDLLDHSAGFRSMVFSAFADRMSLMMQLLEKVSFTRVECRLAEHLLILAADRASVRITQAELATRVGTAREVVSRRLEVWAHHGWVKTGRGTLEILDHAALHRLAEAM